MKKIITLVLILLLSFTSIDTAEAATISKSKATMEVDSTLKLKISGTSDKVTWKSDKKAVATVNSSGTVTAKAEGIATITATVNNVKYTCKITVVDSNKYAVPSAKIKNIDDFKKYLNETYGSVETDMGTMKLTHSVSTNEFSFFEHDYWIKTEWDGIQPYDIKYSILYTSSQKEKTIEKLKEIQLNIYNDFAYYFPDKKVTGGYYKSWYRYPSIQVGFESTRFLTWNNYTDGEYYDEYGTSEIDAFKWDPFIDDYDFTK